jgi:hypothetical protein
MSLRSFLPLQAQRLWMTDSVNWEMHGAKLAGARQKSQDDAERGEPYSQARVFAQQEHHHAGQRRQRDSYVN